jgi:hypothetical protein
MAFLEPMFFGAEENKCSLSNYVSRETIYGRADYSGFLSIVKD